MGGAALIGLALVGPPEDLQVEPAGDYVIVDAAPASAFEPPRPRAIEFTPGFMTMTRFGFTRSRSVDGEGSTSTVVPNRLRARLQARIGDLHALAEFQDARNLGDPIGPARTGFHQLYLAYETALATGGELRFVAGRQEWVDTSGHLSWPGPWGATMRSFDGLNLRTDGPRGGVDLFAGSFARPLLSSSLTLVDHVASDVRLLWHVGGHLKFGSAVSAGARILGNHQRTAAETRNIYTYGVELWGDLTPGLSYRLEGNLQTGEIEVRGAGATTSHAHLAGHAFATLDYMTPEGFGEDGRTKVGAFALLDFASGSKCDTTEYQGLSPCTAGTSRDFYSAYYGFHRWYGHADRFRQQNVIDAAVGAKARVAATKELRLDMVLTEHVFAFPEPGGRWHAFDGALIGVDPDNRNPWASNEVDVEAWLTYRWLRFDVGWLINANLGGGRAVSGEALRQFLYVEVTTNF